MKHNFFATLLLGLTITACGDVTNPPSWKQGLTPAFKFRGATVWADRPVNQQEFEFTLDIALIFANDLGGDYAKLKSYEDVDIHMMASPPVVDGKQVGGVTWTHRKLIEVNYYDPRCLSQSALQHELAHWINYMGGGDGDPNHKDPRFFDQGENQPHYLDMTSFVFDEEMGYCKDTPFQDSFFQTVENTLNTQE